MKFKSVVVSALVLAISASANAYKLTSFNGGRAELSCDDGYFVGFIRRDGDGYYSSSSISFVDKNLNEVISRMMREMRSSCT